MDLTQMKCIACEGNVAPLNETKARVLLAQIPDWELSSDATAIFRTYHLKNFAEALALVDAIGAIAEEEGHHPDIEFGWGRVKVILATHAIHGLSNNDFIVAAKVEQSARKTARTDAE